MENVIFSASSLVFNAFYVYMYRCHFEDCVLHAECGGLAAETYPF